jgi:hypothetical protein
MDLDASNGKHGKRLQARMVRAGGSIKARARAVAAISAA